MNDPFDSPWKRWERFVFEYLVEIFTFSGLALLLLLLFLPGYEKSRARARLAESYQNLELLVEALHLYTCDHPASRVFPPDPNSYEPGFFLCPIRDNDPTLLYFLTTPAPYLDRIPSDPFMDRVSGKRKNSSAAVLHWVKIAGSSLDSPTDYVHIAWGALSVGPSLNLPPQYSIRALRLVPYESILLRQNLYAPTNGLRSLGLLYHDTLGNVSRLDESIEKPKGGRPL
ncbi:MAG: hypothetical protein AB1656_09325 [Candidatus Omnitrophota bacterium]